MEFQLKSSQRSEYENIRRERSRETMEWKEDKELRGRMKWGLIKAHKET